MKIESIEYVNHPILGDLTLNFMNAATGSPYSNILLAGENGVGKSTILKTLNSFLCAGPITPFANIVYVIGEDRYKVVPNAGSRIESFHKRIEISTGNETIINRNNQNDKEGMLADIQDPRSYGSVLSLARADFKTRKIEHTSSKELDVDLHDQDTDDDFTSLKQLLVDISTQDNEDYSRLNEERERNHEVALSRSEFERQHSKICRFKKAFNDFFDNIKFVGISTRDGNKVIVFRKGNDTISIDDLSTGEKQIVFRGAHLLKNLSKLNGATIFIDEPELSMHPLWQQKILSYYRGLFTDANGNQIVQLILATHSEGVLKEALHTQDTLVVTLKQQADGQVVPHTVKGPVVLNFDCDAEINYEAFGTASTDYHNALYGFIEAEGWLNEYENGKTRYPYIKILRNGSQRNENYTKTTIIRHQIHHPENRLNPRYSDQELKDSIDAMRDFIENHP